MDFRNILNEKQLSAVLDINGPILINAGPGSGKSRVITYRTINLLLSQNKKHKDVDASRIIVCTFTEKAADLLKFRIGEALKDTKINLTNLRIGTIHSIFLKYLDQFIEFLPITSGYEVLDEAKRFLFISDYINELGFNRYEVPTAIKNIDQSFYRFNDNKVIFEDLDKFQIIEFLLKFYDNIVDQGLEIIGLEEIRKHNFYKKTTSFKVLFNSYEIYKRLLYNNNFLDYSQIQNLFWKLLEVPEIRMKIRSSIDYILVDEYQDTNYIQERALLEALPANEGEFNKLSLISESQPSKNICVVGDLNQSLYRFRGANIDNILKFSNKFSCKVKEYQLNINYRSPNNLVNFCNEFISDSIDYYNKRFEYLRYGKSKGWYKSINSSRGDVYNIPIFVYQSNDKKIRTFINDVFSAVEELHNNFNVSYSDIAILIPSLKYTEAKEFKSVFGNDKIAVFDEAGFFYDDNVIYCLKSLAYVGDTNKVILNESFEQYLEYVNNIIFKFNNINNEIKINKISLIKANDLIDTLYKIISYNKNITHNKETLKKIAALSKIIKDYNSYSNKGTIFSFFNDFLPHIYYSKTANSYFDDIIELKHDKVKLMTIHGSKGLQFPVTIVGFNKIKERERSVPYLEPREFLNSFLPNEEIEEKDKVDNLQLKRLYYVAFSRAQEILILGSRAKRNFSFINKTKYIVNPQNISNYLPSNFEFSRETEEKEKKNISYTHDILNYLLCPQMYYYSNILGFPPLKSSAFSFGTILHSIIEIINRNAKNGKLNNIMSREEKLLIIDNILLDVINKIKTKFRDEGDITNIRRQVYNYVYQFDKYLDPKHVLAVEEKFLWEEKNFILNGRIDLIIKDNDKIFIVDIKSGLWKNKSPEQIHNAENQVIMYGDYYYKKYDIKPNLVIYSTGESRYQDGFYSVNNYDEKKAFNEIKMIVDKIIIGEDFSINSNPDKMRSICKNCSFKTFCPKYFN